jgi:hypothetical protein
MYLSSLAMGRLTCYRNNKVEDEKNRSASNKVHYVELFTNYLHLSFWLLQLPGKCFIPPINKTGISKNRL